MAGPELILHHYPASPFSEKARLALGLAGLPWRSVITPNMMPKPDLTPLTGGYRRAPVMQIGADIYCDSQVILDEIARLAPAAHLARGAAGPVNLWADRLFFQVSVAIIFGELGDKVDKAFIADREKLSGRPFDTAAMKAAAQPMRQQWRAHAAWIDEALADSPWLSGSAPGLVDISAYMNIWWMGGAMPAIARDLSTGLTRLADWSGRMAAIGHGDHSEMSGAEALEAARRSQPGWAPAHDAADPLGLSPGADVMVMADDYGRDPIVGRLVAATPARIVIARESADLGLTHVHFPRAGYIAAPAKS
jgi:glutathione S-transferase